MAVEIKVPSLGESVTEATIAKWHKSVGDQVKVDELLLELETDKVTLEVSAPANGVITAISHPQGDTVSMGDILGSIEEGAVSQAKASPTEAPAKPMQAPAAAPLASPAASKIAADKGIDTASITGTGRRGMVMKEDVLPLSAQHVVANTSVAREQRVKMTRLRKTIAQRLKDSQNTAAILTTFNEVDLTEAMRIRKMYQESFHAKHGVKLGFMSFFVKAVVAALQAIPSVNAEIDGDDIVYKQYYDIGVAVGTEQGLVVPVLRGADKLSFAEVEKEVVSLGKKAREGKLTMQDMMGGTFSITNGGVYGSLLSTPIINPPQSGILGMHNIVQRPMAVNGQVEIRPMMYIALSYDHRLIDGKEAVTFLIKIKELVENPEKLLFDI